MTVAEVAERVAQIKATQGDDEGAHLLEDNLYRDVLLAISKGTVHAQALAEQALRTQQVRFDRACW